jgi:hypothetical protein
MTVNYKGLINGNINPIDLAKLINKTYGGLHGMSGFSIHFTGTDGFYQICFGENPTEDQLTLRPWEKTKACRRRTLSVFIDYSCAGDYEEITTEPMTYVSLGHSGDCREIIDALVRSQGGYVLDECGPGETKDEWVRLDVAEAARKLAAETSTEG